MAGKNTIEIGLIVNDNGQLVGISQKANKLGKQLDKTAGAAAGADRNLKGVAQASSTGTKNFSKMAQGITSGLVPAYATLAANIFAISAAFNFFKRQADLQILENSQVSYANNTGLALGTLTERLKDASDGMLSFQQASQAAAIGVAKGFSPKQLEDLAEGARKVSTALGRDFEDSFDRLVRGVSKAEPELLDELGITLRLETATKNYATSLDIAENSLTEYQRSQAVLIETQRQLDDQFSSVDPETNPFVELQRTFEEIVRTGTKLVLPFFKAFASIINSSAPAAVAVFSAIGVSIARAAIPMDEINNKITEFAENSKASVSTAEARIKSYSNVISDLSTQMSKVNDEAAAFGQVAATNILSQGNTKSPLLRKVASGEDLYPRQNAALSAQLKAAEAQYRNQGKVISGIFAGASKTALQDMRDLTKGTSREFSILTRRGIKRNVDIWDLRIKKFAATTKKEFAGIKASGAAAFAGVGKAAQGASKAVGVAFRLAGVLGILTIIGQSVKKILDSPFTIVSTVLRGLGKLAQVTQKILTFYVKEILSLPFKVSAGLLLALQEQLNKIIRFINEVKVLNLELDLVNFGDAAADGVANVIDGLPAFEFGDRIAEDIEGALQNNSFLQGLREREDAATALREAKEEFKSFQSILKQAEKDANKAAEGISKAESAIEKTSKKANAVVSLGIGSLIEKLQNIEGLPAALRQQGLDELQTSFATLIEQIPQIGTALANLDVKGLKRMESAAGEAVSATSAVSNGIANLGKEINANDLNASALFVEGLLATAASGDKQARRELGGTLGLVERVNAAFGEGQNAAVEFVNRIKGIAAEQRRIIRETSALDVAAAKAGRFSPISKRRVEELLEVERQRLLVQQAQTDLAAAQAKAETANSEQLEAAEKLVEEREAELRLVEATYEVVKQTAQQSTRIADTIRNGLESGFQQGLASLIKNQESSLKDVILNIAKTTLESTADTLSTILTEKVFGQKGPAQKIYQAIKDGADYLSEKISGAIKGESRSVPGAEAVETVAEKEGGIFSKGFDFL